MVDAVDDQKSSSSIRGISMPNFEVLDARILQPWTQSSIIPISKEESVWRNNKPRKRTVSFAADRWPTWSTNNSGSLGAMILSKTISTCSLVLFEITIFRNSTRIDEILWSMTKIPSDDTLEGLYKLRKRVWETQDRIGIVWPGDSSEEVRTWLSQIESYGEKKYRTRNFK